MPYLQYHIGDRKDRQHNAANYNLINFNLACSCLGCTDRTAKTAIEGDDYEYESNEVDGMLWVIAQPDI